MSMELVSQVLIGILVFGGLALHEPIVDRVASLESDPELVTWEERE
ncbi:MAG: hypothetical protein U5K28_10790 [Halobacteriales archaeon]|nr:hypothetical protein [Halobacteriales archaeon]